VLTFLGEGPIINTMKYMGSKSRIAAEILPIILKDRQPDQCYVEPFVGGGNLIDKVDGWRIGADFNPYVIESLILIRDRLDLLPRDNTEFTEADYKLAKVAGLQQLKGYAGFALSYGGKWFGGWCRRKGVARDDVAEAYRNSVKQSPGLQGGEADLC